MKRNFSVDYEQDKEYKLSDLKPFEIDLLKRVIELCFESRENGNHPFACLLADKDGNILLEQMNTEGEDKADCTGHAETQLMRKASQIYSKEEMETYTLYNCAEPCAMCAASMYWGSLGRMVYIGRESELLKHTGDDPRNPTLNLPCRAVFASGQKNIVVEGPFIEMEEDFFKSHENYWNPSK